MNATLKYRITDTQRVLVVGGVWHRAKGCYVHNDLMVRRTASGGSHRVSDTANSQRTIDGVSFSIYLDRGGSWRWTCFNSTRFSRFDQHLSSYYQGREPW